DEDQPVPAPGGPLPGPTPGTKLVLDRSSISFQMMAALGGECLALAEAMATYGAVIIDRNAYSDVEPHRRPFDRGEKPHEPTIAVQSGAQWKGTNVAQFTVALGDLL